MLWHSGTARHIIGHIIGAPMFRLLIIVFALVAAVGGGVGGLVHFAIIPDFTGGAIANIVGVVGQKSEAEAAAEAAAPPPRVEPVYMQVSPMLIPVIQGGELKRNIYIALRIELEAGKQAEGAAAMPRLQDLYLRALYEIIPEQQKTSENLDLQKVRERLLAISERAVGPGVVKDIVFQSVFSR